MKILKGQLIKIYLYLWSFFYRKNLTKLAALYGSDKWGEHFYTPHYQTHLAKYRKKKIKVLEIGIGGYKNPLKGGRSLRMWRAFFSKAEIYGVDIYDKHCHDEKRIKTRKGSQVDEQFLADLLEESGGFDIIIDDGSHINEHVIKSFEYLFPHLREGGTYVVEDTQTSYWPRYGGSDSDCNLKSTSMGFFKSLVDGLNYEEYRVRTNKPTYYDQNITEMHFYHNMVFIQKDKNIEGSQMLGRRPYRF